MNTVGVVRLGPVQLSSGSSIESAFASLNHAQGVILAAGSYPVSSAGLVWTTGPIVSLKGASSGTTIIDCSAVTAGTACLQVSGGTDIIISGITLRGGGSHHRDRGLISTAPGITLVDPVSVHLLDVAFEGFASETGAGLSIYCSTIETCTSVSVQDSLFYHNSAASFGGAVFLSLSVSGRSIAFINNVFDTNSAAVSGGAIYWQRTASSTTDCTASTSGITFTGCTFTDKAILHLCGEQR